MSSNRDVDKQQQQKTDDSVATSVTTSTVVPQVNAPDYGSHVMHYPQQQQQQQQQQQPSAPMMPSSAVINIDDLFGFRPITTAADQQQHATTTTSRDQQQPSSIATTATTPTTTATATATATTTTATTVAELQERYPLPPPPTHPVGYRDQNNTGYQQRQQQQQPLRSNEMVFMYLGARPMNELTPAEVNFLELQTKASIVKLLAFIDILFGVLWFFSNFWWLGFGVLFGFIGYIGASLLNRKLVFIYMVYLAVYMTMRVGLLIYEMSVLDVQFAWYKAVWLALLVFIEIFIIRFVWRFWKAIPSDASDYYRAPEWRANMW